MEFENVLNRLGKFGFFQKRVCVMLFFAGIPNAFPNIMFTYTQYQPKFHCAVPPTFGNVSKNSTEYEQLLNLTVPWESDGLGGMRRSECEMFDMASYNQTNSSFSWEPKKIPCTNGWEYENMDTVTSEFDLVCKGSWKPPFVITLYMIGMALAAFSGILSDKFGRRPVFLFFTFGQFLMTGLTGFSWNFESYAISTLVVGFFGLVNYVVSYVFATEMMGVKRQLMVGMLCCIAYSVGYTMSPILGYFFPSWRWYLRSNAILGLFYLPLLWFFPESLRWLMVSGREKEAKQLLKYIADTNGKSIDVDDIYNEFNIALEEAKRSKRTLMSKKHIDMKKESNYLHLLKNPTMRLRCAVLCLSWFVTSLVYFAISLNPSQLSGDRLMNIFLSGIVELPSFVVSFILPDKIGRIRTLFFFLVTSGSCCVISPFLRADYPIVTTVLVLTGKCAITGVFNVVYLLASEISPTLVRTTSLGVASVCARIGGITMPYLMFVGENDQIRYVPFVVMGSLALVTAVFNILFMPETAGVPMPNTINEAVENKRIFGINICRKFEDTEPEEEEKLQLA
uniref:solute carrier family 22 member 5-like isoform X1 n=1 Tax=Styela clava TaxID=7725 RepID=UPI001939C542|nr:solute carrier family 22 member 5-like isoform X1 [Styela clava]